MTFSPENLLLIGSLLLFISTVASKTTFTLGIPSLVLFLIVGMLAGSDGPGGIYFNDPETTQLLGIIALAVYPYLRGRSDSSAMPNPTPVNDNKRYSTDMNELRAKFNQDRGKVRLILLLSPT